MAEVFVGPIAMTMLLSFVFVMMVLMVVVDNVKVREQQQYVC